ncbi:MAG: peptidoglycan-binding protein [Candidatus Pacebacteria bacterium]|nr:peptidoglycan-binding protein [Candidatus Paceibacterota bacterium]
MQTGHKGFRSKLILIALLACILVPAARASAVGESADGLCQPYYEQCPCNEKPDSSNPGKCSKGSNTHACPVGICQDVTNGQPTQGICVAAGKCLAQKTDGKTPQQVTPQQKQQATNGASANGTQTNANPSASPTVSGANPASASSGATPAASAQPTTVGTPTQGSSLLQDAYQWISGQNGTVPPQYVGGEPNGSTGQSLSDQAAWLPDAQQSYQLQSSVPAPPLESSPVGGSTDSSFSPVSNPGFAPVSTPDGNLGPSLQDVAQANSLVTQTPGELAMQDAQSVAKGIADTGGSWAQSALSYVEQNTFGSQQPGTGAGTGETTPATIYYPGCVGGPTGCSVVEEGGLYGTHDNYLDPKVPTVAAGYNSGYSYGDVLKVTNPDTGQSITAVVGDSCSACGKGIDLNPAAANAVGLTQDQGRADMQVSLVNSTGGYSSGVQVASTLNSLWNSTPGSLPSDSYTPGPLAEGWTASIGGSSQFQSPALADSGTAYPAGQVDSSPLLEPTGSANFQPISATQDGGLSGGVLQGVTPSLAPYTEPQVAVDQGPANPSGNVTQGPQLEAPYPAGQVTSSALPLSDQQIAANIPTPEQVQTDAQASIEAQLAQDAQQTQLNDRLAQADAQTVAFNNPILPPVNTDLPSGQALTQQIYDSAIAGAGNQVPVPSAAEVNIPTQAQAQAQLLTQGQSLSPQDANSFYNSVQGNTPDYQAAQQAQLQDRLAQADQQTAAYDQALKSAPSQVPVPDTSVQSGEALTNQIAHEVAAQAPVAQSVPTPPVEQSALAPVQASLTDRVSSAVSNAANYVQDAFQNSVDSLRQIAIAREIPTPSTDVQSGEQVTAQIQQTVAAQMDASLAGTPPPASAAATLADVTSADRNFSLIDTNSSIGSDANGTKLSTDSFDPNSVALGAASYNPDVAKTITDATQFQQDVQPIENPPLPTPRPADAGQLGLNLAGCGGVCEVGNTGADVKTIQQFLNQQGFSLKVDGVYGAQTQAAVETFQKGNGIQSDGAVGPQTAGVMNNVAASEGQIAVQQSGDQVTQQVQQAAAQQQADQLNQEKANAASAGADQTPVPAPEKTYTLSNAGDLRGDFLVNPILAAAIPPSMKEAVLAAYDSGASSVTFSQSQLDSIQWNALSASQVTQLQSMLGNAGYQLPADIAPFEQPGLGQIGFLQTNAINTSYLKVCWTTGFCY